ncbi:natural resistance-associated macrophage protein-domain-containing protein [Scenedesmus sp. NREL 46B-D3]|nr:natural resistance-associated macrophage protein-domain-containing protein [Scenedesmus sp. NREL 46B-D3]
MGLVTQTSAELPLLGAYEVSFSLNRFVKFIGPGLLMSIAYVDPGNLESDLQVGASAGYALLWVLLWCTVLGYVIQMQAAKLGVVTRQHLAEHCRQQFSPGLRYFLWIMAEIAIIGSDIQEVIGSAIALLLLSRGAVPLWAGVLLSMSISFVLLLVERCGVSKLEALFALLISVMVGSFAVMFYQAHVPLAAVAEGFLKPTIPRPAIGQAVALVGSLIMPHNIYLHSALVQTRTLRHDDDAHKKEALVYYGLESALSLLVSVFINAFVTCVFAAGFYGKALQDIGLENAGQYLGEAYGPALVYVWALGLLAAGQSSTMTGAYTGQFVMTGYLQLKISPWLRILLTRSVALVPALVVSLLTRNDSGSTALDALNQWLNLLQSVQLPFALIPVLAFNGSEALMGKFKNGRAMMAGTVCISLAVMLINVSGVLAFAEAALSGVGKHVWALVALGMALYMLSVGYVFVHSTAAAGLLPASIGWLADEPGGSSGDAVSGGRFRRVPSCAATVAGGRLGSVPGGLQENLQEWLLQESGADVNEQRVRVLEGQGCGVECAAPCGELEDELDEEAGVSAAGLNGGSSRERWQQQQQRQLTGVSVATSAVPAWRSSEP